MNLYYPKHCEGRQKREKRKKKVKGLSFRNLYYENTQTLAQKIYLCIL